MNEKLRRYLSLFISTFKISAFTFGGGFVIIPLMRKQFVHNLKWIDDEEMLDLTAIAQSSPGAIAVNASILEVREEGDLRRVAVYFDVLMREDQRAARPEQVREVWHFVCSRREGDSWKLDGIQQLS